MKSDVNTTPRLTHFLPARHILKIIEKAKCIFNTIIDAGDDGVNVSTILTHLAKFGENWEKFHKTAAGIKIITGDKLTSLLTKFNSYRSFLSLTSNPGLLRKVLPTSEKITELDQLRNAALTGSEAYSAKAKVNERYDILNQVKAVTDSMPVLAKLTAVKLAERVQDKVRTAIMTSIWGKITSHGDLETEGMIAYTKTQKKDT